MLIFEFEVRVKFFERGSYLREQVKRLNACLADVDCFTKDNESSSNKTNQHKIQVSQCSSFVPTYRPGRVLLAMDHVDPKLVRAKNPDRLT